MTLNQHIRIAGAFALFMLALQPGCVTAQDQGGAEASNYLTDAQVEAGWELMFNGQDLDGWQTAEENPESFSVEDDCLVAHGPRCHLFFGVTIHEHEHEHENGTGTGIGQRDFQDFEFQCDVYCDGASNSGIFFHTGYQARGWPRQGFEAQVCNGFGDPRKTGSIYAVSDIRDDSPVQDDVWFHYRILVQGNNVKIWIDSELVMDWTQPEDWADQNKRLGGGTFALQAHDPNSRVLFRNMMVREIEE